MDVSRNETSERRSSGARLYLNVLDKLLRDTEDGKVMWTSEWERVEDDRGGRSDYTIYNAETSAGTLRLHGLEEQLRELDQRHDPVSTAASPAHRGEARLFLVTEEGRAVPFPPVPGRALQSILDNLLTVVRYKVEGPLAEEFAHRFLAGGDGATASPA